VSGVGLSNYGNEVDACTKTLHNLMSITMFPPSIHVTHNRSMNPITGRNSRMTCSLMELIAAMNSSVPRLRPLSCCSWHMYASCWAQWSRQWDPWITVCYGIADPGVSITVSLTLNCFSSSLPHWLSQLPEFVGSCLLWPDCSFGGHISVEKSVLMSVVFQDHSPGPQYLGNNPTCIFTAWKLTDNAWGDLGTHIWATILCL